MTGGPERRDYVAWHEAYDDPDSALSWRLGVVRSMIGHVLDQTPGEVRVLSSCAGDGRDVLGVLAGRSDARRVHLTLLELDPVLAARAADVAGALDADVEVRQIDAGRTDAYAGAVPADLVLLVGVFGNVATPDIEATIRSAPQLCTEGGRIIWTLGRATQDRDVPVRSWLAKAGFEEERYEALERGSRPSVGLARLTREPAALEAGIRLFEFIR